MAGKKRPPPDLAATTVMNDATRLAQQDAPAEPNLSSSTQFLADAVEQADAVNRTTIDGSRRSDDARILNVPRQAPPMAKTPARRVSPTIAVLLLGVIAAAAALAWANGFFG